MMRSRSQSRSTSTRSWVVSRTVVPCSRLISTRNSRTASWLITSSPMVGSSSSRIDGSWSRAAVSSPRMRWPSESCRTGTSSSGSSSSPAAKRREVGGVALRGHGVDVPQQVEAVPQGEVPPQLGALAEHHADATGQLGALAARFESVDADVTRRGHEDPREHLDGGRLAGTVRADEAHHGTALDLQVDAADGHHLLATAAHPTGLAPHHELLGESRDVDDRIRGHDQLPVLRWWRTASRQMAPATPTAAAATAGVAQAASDGTPSGSRPSIRDAGT